MKKVYSTLLLLVSWVLLNAQTKEVNDPNAELRKVKGFHAIKVSHAIDLYLSQSNDEVVAVSAAREEYRNKIKTQVENGVLKIWYDQDLKWSGGDKKLKAYISFITLDQLTASGASDLYVTGTVRSDDLDIKMSGASDFNGAIQATSLKIDLSGASHMTVTGSVTTINIEVSGASDFKGYDLQSENCLAKASGASEIKVTVNKELYARASGASGVHYRGNGVIRELKSNGGSSVGKKG